MAYAFWYAYQLNSLFIFMMLFLFNVQLRNKYDDDDASSKFVCLSVRVSQNDRKTKEPTHF